MKKLKFVVIIAFSLVLLLIILLFNTILNKLNIELTIEEQIINVKKVDEYKRSEVGFDYNTIYDKYDIVRC